MLIVSFVNIAEGKYRTPYTVKHNLTSQSAAFQASPQIRLLAFKLSKSNQINQNDHHQGQPTSREFTSFK